MSNMVPKRDIWEFCDKSAESRNAKEIPNPETKSHDLGKIIFPSKNLAIAQKTIVNARPKTKSSPLEVSTGIFVKGKQNKGSNTSTRNNDKKESLSKIFELMVNIILYINKQTQ